MNLKMTFNSYGVDAFDDTSPRFSPVAIGLFNPYGVELNSTRLHSSMNKELKRN